MKSAFLAIACDTLTLPDGTPALGVETELACDKAIELARMRSDGDYVVVCAAGVIPGFNVTLSSLMAEKFRSAGIPDDKIVELTAERYYTFSEIMAMIAYLTSHPDISEVVMCVKWWHAARTKVLMHFFLKWEEIDSVEYHVALCESRVGMDALVTEVENSALKNILVLRYFWIRYNLLDFEIEPS